MPGGILNRLISSFLRLFFYLIYKPLAWSYDWVAHVVSVGKWQAWILSVLPELNGPRILELGHGPGHLQKAALEKGYWTCGLDESRQMGRIALSRLRESDLKPNLVNARAQRLPFADGSYSQIVATFPTAYLVEQETLSEVWRVLCPGGKLIAMPVAWITGKGVLERAAAWLFHITGQAPEWEDHLLEPVIKAGFEIEVERRSSDSSVVLLIKALKNKV